MAFLRRAICILCCFRLKAIFKQKKILNKDNRVCISVSVNYGRLLPNVFFVHKNWYIGLADFPVCSFSFVMEDKPTKTTTKMKFQQHVSWVGQLTNIGLSRTDPGKLGIKKFINAPTLFALWLCFNVSILHHAIDAAIKIQESLHILKLVWNKRKVFCIKIVKSIWTGVVLYCHYCMMSGD